MTGIPIPRTIVSRETYASESRRNGCGGVAEATLSRRLGQVNILLQFSQLQPMTFRRVMTVFYVKEVLYYMVWTVLPLIAGIAVTTPFSGISALGIAQLALTVSLTFLLGMSVSFTISTLAGHSKALAAASGFSMIGLMLSVWPLSLVEAPQVEVALRPAYTRVQPDEQIGAAGERLQRPAGPRRLGEERERLAQLARPLHLQLFGGEDHASSRVAGSSGEPSAAATAS